MDCPSCNKEIVADKLFCTWCDTFIPNTQSGIKAGVFRMILRETIGKIVSGLFLVVIGGKL